jgi:Restriction alleviation protein Lar
MKEKPMVSETDGMSDTEEEVVSVWINPVGWQLLPCPFCGSDELTLSVDTGDGGRISCEECQTKGPYETVDGDDAEPPYEKRNLVTLIIEIWNKRQST